MKKMLTATAISSIFLALILGFGLIGSEEPVEEEYVIGPEDILEISVWQHEDLAKKAIVRPDGKISFSLIGDINASGRTISQLREDITKELSTYIRDPQVTVMVVEFNSKKVNVLGEVVSPGLYRLKGRTRILDLVTIAGGPKPDAHMSDVTVMDKDGKITHVDIDDLLNNGTLSQNVIIKAGDTVKITKTGTMKKEFVMVIGEVGRQGSVEIIGGEKFTLSTIIGMAGGPAPSADLKKVSFIRKGEEKKTVNLDAIYKGDLDKDVTVKTGDIIILNRGAVEQILVLGQLNSPKAVRVKADEPISLLELVSACGGPAPKADLENAKIISKNGKSKIVNLKNLLQKGEMEENIEVGPGDILYVPEVFEDQVVVYGEVARPGVYAIRKGEQPTIAKILAMAGGYKESADLFGAYLIREEEKVPVDLVKLLKNADVSANIELAAGDILFIPQESETKNKILVIGEVKNQGVIKMEATEDLPVSSAITLAGGVTKDADMEMVKVYRGAPGKVSTAFNVDLKLIFEEGKRDKDIILKPNDIVFVPKTGFAKWSEMSQSIIPTLTIIYQVVSTTTNIISWPLLIKSLTK